MKKNFRLIVAVLISASFTPTHAQQEAESLGELLELSLEELMNITITTATKTEGQLDLAPSVIDVVTGDQIRNRGYQNLGQLLNDIANNHQDRSNWGIGEPTQQNVGFGFRFDTGQNILLLFNGQRLNAFLPGNRFGGEEHLPNNIDRIEIIRGPGSALYGTGAFTAVVNIISKRAEKADEHFTSQAELVPTSGGFAFSNSFGLTAGDNGSLTGAFRYFSEEGQSLSIQNALFGNQRLRDGVDHAIDGELVFRKGNTSLHTKLTNQRRNTFTGFNGVNPGELEQLKLSMYAYAIGIDHSIRLNEKSTLKLSAGWHQDNWTEIALIPQFKVNDDGTALLLDENGLPQLDTLLLFRDGRYIETPFFIDGQGADTRSLDAEAQFTFKYYKNNHLVLGVYVADDRILDATRPTELNLDPLMFIPFAPLDDPNNNWLLDMDAARKTWAPFIQGDYSVTDNITISAGLRVDNYSGTGRLKAQQYSEWNPRAAIVYSAESTGTIKAMFGTATRIPNGFETLSTVSILGNPENKAERINTSQIQWIRNWSNSVRTEAGFFRSVITNRLETNALISDELRAQGFIGQFVNAGPNLKQVNNGTDLKAVARIANKGTMILNWTQYFGSNDGRGNAIAYIPNTMINIDYNIPLQPLNVNVGLNYRSKFTKAASDPRAPVDSYVIARMSVSYAPKAIPFQLQATARNLLDSNYSFPSSSQDFPRHFPARGIEIALALTYSPALHQR